MLYLPPGIAHEGVAVGGDCMTYSVGFRGPARSELVAHYCDHLLATLDDDDRYTDPDLIVPANPGEISAAAIARLHDLVVDRLSDRAAFARWFGAYTTAPADTDHVVGDVAPLPALVGRFLSRNPASRFSFIRRRPGDIVLFVDGASYDCSGDVAVFAEAVCAARCVGLDPWVGLPRVHALVSTLIAAGGVAFSD